MPRMRVVIDNMMPPSRRGNANAFCRSLTSNLNFEKINDVTSHYDFINDFARFRAGYEVRESRYIKLNCQCYQDYRTIEFRHHNGTTKSSEIISWILICLKMVQRAETPLKNDPNHVVEEVSFTRQTCPFPSFIPYASHSYKIMMMLFREEGVTSEEVTKELGRSNWGTIRTVAERYNVPYRYVHVGNHVKRFFVKSEMVRNVKKNFSLKIETSFDVFVEDLKLDVFEASLIQDRMTKVHPADA